jgi:hypothetical protein
MPSRSDQPWRTGRGSRRALLISLLLVGWLLTPGLRAAEPVNSVPTDSEVRHALNVVKADPLMGQQHTEKRLRWRQSDTPEEEESRPWLQRLLQWLRDSILWIARSARALVLVVATLAVAMLGVVLWRSWRTRQPKPDGIAPPPTHVRGLDIRPQALPNDIAAAAQKLWNDGGHRAALLLLYRGLLSRLVHGHGVAIRDSSTEGDCLRQATLLMHDAPLAFVARVVSCCQRAFYGASWPTNDEFSALCGDFDTALAEAPPAPVPNGAGVAVGAGA